MRFDSLAIGSSILLRLLSGSFLAGTCIVASSIGVNAQTSAPAPPAFTKPPVLIPLTTGPPTSPLPDVPIPILPPAPPAASGPLITLDDFIQQVLEVNPGIQQAKIALQRAHQQVFEADSTDLPQLRIGASDTYSSSPTIGSAASGISSISAVNTTPIITDAASGTIFSQTLSGSSSTISAGAGSTTITTAIAPTINTVTPVSAPVSSSSPSTTGVLSNTTTVPTSPATGNAVSRANPDAALTSNSSNSASTPNNTRLNNWGASGSVTQYIDIFGLEKTNIEIAHENVKFYDLDLIRQENEEALTAKDIYFAVIKAQSDVTTATEQLTNANAILTNTKVLSNAGADAQFDVISSEATVSSAESSLLTAQNELTIERANFNTLLVRSLNSPVQVASVVPENIPYDASADTYINIGDTQRPEALETVITQDIAHKLIFLAHQGLLPSVGLTGSYEYSPVVASSSSPHSNAAIIASLSIPLYDGGFTHAAVNIGHLNETQQQLIAQNVKLNIALEVQTALVNVLSAEALVASNQAGVAENREALTLSQLRYKSQVTTLLEVTNAEANLASAEANLNSAIYQQQTADAALQRAEGKR